MKSKRDSLRILHWINSSNIVTLCFFIFFVVWYWYIMSGVVFWRDEAHALLIARENGSFLSLFNAVRYEGTPGLWHIILWITSKFCDLTPLVAKFVHFTFFMVSLFILLFLIKIKNIFRFFLLIQYPFIYYAVYIRQYQILVTLILLFTYIYLESNNRENIWIYIVLFFIAQTCIHGIIISLGLFLFVVFNNYFRSKKVNYRYYIIPIISYVLAFIQLIPPPDLIGRLTEWNILFTMEELSEARMNVVGESFLNNYVIEFLLIICFFAYKNRYFRRAKVVLVSFLLSFSIIFFGFLVIELLKYSLLWHHLLLSYVMIFFIIVIVQNEGKNLQKEKLLYIIILPLFLLSVFQLYELSLENKFELRSNSKNVAEFLDSYYPRNKILSITEVFEEPIRIYRKNQVLVYALGRREYVKYTVWNHWSVDGEKFPFTVQTRLSNIISELQAIPNEVLANEPVLIITCYSNLRNWNDLNLENIFRIKINSNYVIEFVKFFIGAQEEDYYLYIVKPINE